MKTLLDFGQEVVKIREAANSLEVKGEHNASIIVYIYQKCNNIITEINEAARAMSESNQNGSEEAEVDVPDTGSSESDINGNLR